MRRPIEIGPDLVNPEQGRIAIFFRNVTHKDGPAVLNITAPRTQDCVYKGPSRIVVDGRQTESGFEITLGPDVVAALQPGLSLRLTIEGTNVGEEFLWLGDTTQPLQFLHNVAQPAPVIPDLLRAQLRLVETSKVIPKPFPVNEAAPKKFRESESPKSENQRSAKVPAYVAIALAAFLSGAAVSSLVWLNADEKFWQSEPLPPTSLGSLGYAEGRAPANVETGIEQTAPQAAIDDRCAASSLPQLGLAPLTQGLLSQPTESVLVQLCPRATIWFNTFLMADLAGIMGAKAGSGWALPEDPVLGSHPLSLQDSAGQARGISVGSKFEGPVADGKRAPLPISLARFIPQDGDQLTLSPPPLEKPKTPKHGRRKAHRVVLRSPPVPPQRLPPRGQSLFSQVSDYLSGILHKL